MSALPLILMLAARPTVAVEIHPDPFVEAHAHAEMTALRGWLVRRLLEEGYDVAADPAAAHGVVRVRAAEGGLVVEAEGHARRSYAIERMSDGPGEPSAEDVSEQASASAASAEDVSEQASTIAASAEPAREPSARDASARGPDPVLRLEVLHHALLGVEQTCDARQPLSAPRLGLALRFAEGQHDDALLEAVAVVAQSADVTLTAHPLPGDTLACVERRGSLAEVALGPAEAGCGPPVLVLELGDGTPEARRRAARALLDAVRVPAADDEPLDVRSLGGPPPGDPVPPPAAVREDGDPVAMHGPPRAEMRLGVSGGVASRGQWVDPIVQGGWRMGKIDGLGGRVSVSMVPSRGGTVRVLDSRFVVGPDWAVRAGRRSHLELAALVGADVHTFDTETHTAGDVAFAAELPLTWSLTLRRATRLQLAVTPGISSQAWEHRRTLLRAQEQLWSRPRWRVGFSVGITHGWRIE